MAALSYRGRLCGGGDIYTEAGRLRRSQPSRGRRENLGQRKVKFSRHSAGARELAQAAACLLPQEGSGPERDSRQSSWKKHETEEALLPDEKQLTWNMGVRMGMSK